MLSFDKHNTLSRFFAIPGPSLYLIIGVFLVAVSLVQDVRPVLALSSDISVSSKNGRVTLSATDADLKEVLTAFSNVTNIEFTYPASLEKHVTVEKENISLKDALRNLLRGLNYAIVYKSVSKRNQPVISNVRIFSKVKVSSHSSKTEARLLGRIKSYQKTISSLEKKLTRPNLSSHAKKNYTKRIERLRSSIERLERKLY